MVRCVCQTAKPLRETLLMACRLADAGKSKGCEGRGLKGASCNVIIHSPVRLGGTNPLLGFRGEVEFGGQDSVFGGISSRRFGREDVLAHPDARSASRGIGVPPAGSLQL